MQMPPLLTCRDVSKQFGAATLFREISFAVHDGDRHGLIGPNGSGKSTLLKILAGIESPSSGEVAVRKGLRMQYVPQDPVFDPALAVGEIIRAEAREGSPVEVIAGQAGFHEAGALAGTLSGGWKKRLAIARALAAEPDLLLLDEPTNHLDLEGIEWLEDLLVRSPFASVIISHDRYFLENVATQMAEMNRRYPGGLYRVAGTYTEFLVKREEYLEAQEKQREALAAVVRREVEWLRRGAKARTRKAKARMDDAVAKIRTLEDMESRRRSELARIEFTASDRKTKKLLETTNLGVAAGGRRLFGGINLVLSPGQRLGLAGANGSGKTTLLHVLSGALSPAEGTIRRADFLKVVYFEQARQQIDPAIPLQRALAPEGDSVIFRGRPVHVNSWAKRFLFREEQLPQPVGSLSGGERARVHIARLMLEQADLLLLDEPTNDLDIPTLEVLEENLLDFPGALVLVTHDRFLMDRVATGVLGLDGQGGAGIYADLAQWEAALEERAAHKSPARQEALPSVRASSPRKKLSYMEQREWDSIEGKILEAERRLEAARATMQAPETVCDATRLEAAYQAFQATEQEVAALYDRWSELAARMQEVGQATESSAQ